MRFIATRWDRIRTARLWAFVALVASACFSDVTPTGQTQGEGSEGGTASTGSSASASTSAAETSSGESGSRGSSTDATADGPTTDAPECGDLPCVAPGPPMWAGPVLVGEHAPGRAPPACPPATERVDLEAGRGLHAARWECGACGCEASGTSCPATVTSYIAENCTGALSDSAVAPNTCTPVGIGASFRLVASPNPDGCEVTTDGAPALPAPSWDAVVRACRAVDPAMCGDGGSCLPTAPGLDVCLWTEGDRPCPGGWTQRSIYFRGVEDTRTCSACSCGPPSVNCSGLVAVADESDCGAGLDGFGPDGSCLAPTFAGDPVQAFVEWAPADPNGSCTPSGGAPAGGLTATDPVTVCCAG